jgi:hypothetical protein
MRTSKTEKTRREAILTAQSHECALCHETMPTAFRMILVEKQNAIVCRACGQFMSVYAASVARGVTPETLAVFLARDAAPEPTATSVAQHKKLLPEQLRTRFDAATQWDCLAEYDKRFGWSGPVINPDTGEEWVPLTTEDSPPDQQSDRLMVDGVWCEVVDGAWVPMDPQPE